MRFNWKPLRLAIVPAVLLLVIMTTGCGGISGSHSISPATFFLPGLVQSPVAPTTSATHPAPAIDLAQSR